MSDFFLQTANEANALDDVQIIEQSKVVYQTHVQLQCIRKVAVHLWKVLEVMSTRIYMGLKFPSCASPCAITFQLDSTVA